MLMVYYYKSSGEKSRRYVLLPGLSLVLLLLMSFTENVIMTVPTGRTLRVVESLCFIVTNLYILRLIVIRHYKNLQLVWVMRVGLLIMAIIGVFRSEWLVNSYDFELTTYGMLYKGILLLIGITGVGLLWYRLRENRGELLYILGVFLWALPLNFYISLQLISGNTAKFLDYGLYLLIAVYVCITAEHYLPYRISASIFNDVKNLMTDYVIITDKHGEVMYHSKSVMSTGVFKTRSAVDFSNIKALFSVPVSVRLDYGRQLIVFNTETPLYLSYTRKAIKEDAKDVGYILTFIDTTELIQMLDQLRGEQIKMEKTNRLLVSHKEVVYEVEKEKEINNLLNDIASNQALSMRTLKKELDGLLESGIDDQRLSDLLEKAQQDLKDVRAAVKTYVDYYTEE